MAGPPPGGAPNGNDHAFFEIVHPPMPILQRPGQELIAVVPRT
jgi:hypothetical protein